MRIPISAEIEPERQAFVDDHATPRATDGFEYRRRVERPQDAQIEHFGLYALLAQKAGRRQRFRQASAISDQADVATGTPNLRVVDIDGADAGIEIFLDIVEHDMFENQRRVWIPERAEKHEARVFDRRRR